MSDAHTELLEFARRCLSDAKGDETLAIGIAVQRLHRLSPAARWVLVHDGLAERLTDSGLEASGAHGRREAFQVIEGGHPPKHSSGAGPRPRRPLVLLL